ncbi:VPLPA-CTERM sorting domain-containing protein [Roseovarius aestuariivivens]|uniref:VPLPA-CTERM sorting domain-containing protein n=1 Tax=Roseovarius aestuariivivens TaxID=1888910 RepID=UPI001FD8E22D|nr:VPLPA-CTERM sorting domain-containing protein [Roseovarius aestuariivivens]
MFTDRTTFDAATSNLSLETFNGVSGQPNFVNTPLVVNDLTLETSGTSVLGGERNAIDQPPAQFVPDFDIDGTASANILLSAADHVFSVTFASAVTAFFADFAALNDNQLRTQISVNGTVVTPATTSGNIVRGFGFTSDTAFTSVRFTYVDNDGFTMDNVAYGGVAPIPLPASLPLLLAGVGAFGLLRRRRGQVAA